jgi:hypothetical protein
MPSHTSVTKWSFTSLSNKLLTVLKIRPPAIVFILLMFTAKSIHVFIQCKADITSMKDLSGFEDRWAVTVKCSIFYVATPCSLVKAYRCFGGTYGLHLLDKIVSKARNRQKAGSEHRTALFQGTYYVNSLKMVVGLFTNAYKQELILLT